MAAAFFAAGRCAGVFCFVGSGSSAGRGGSTGGGVAFFGAAASVIVVDSRRRSECMVPIAAASEAWTSRLTPIRADVRATRLSLRSRR